MGWQLGPIDVRDHPTIGEIGVVMNDEHTVARAPNIEFDAIGSHFHGASKCAHRVLGLGLRGAPVGDHGGHDHSMTSMSFATEHRPEDPGSPSSAIHKCTGCG
jgi:hypothetical protein